MIRRYKKLFYHMMRRLCCKLNYGATDDIVAWHLEKSEVFIVHGAYRLGMQEHLLEASSGHSSEASNRERLIWNLIWKCSVPPKLHVFPWRLVKKSLATMSQAVKGSLHQRISTICPQREICGREVEDEHHAVVRFTLASALQGGMRKYWTLPSEVEFAACDNEWFFRLLS
jgi:hypothetical protein